MTARLVSFLTLLTGGGLAVVAAAQPWWRAVGEGVSTTFSGTEVTAGLSQALAVVVLAGTLLMLVLRARGRRVVGVLLGLVGAGIAVAGLLRQAPSADAVRNQVREVSLVDQFALQATAWAWVYAAAGFITAVGAVLTVASARSWPTRPDRFNRADAPVRPVSANDDPMDVWKALDAGLDPTTEADPDVRKASPADTMEPTNTGHDTSADGGSQRSRPAPVADKAE